MPKERYVSSRVEYFNEYYTFGHIFISSDVRNLGYVWTFGYSMYSRVLLAFSAFLHFQISGIEKWTDILF